MTVEEIKEEESKFQKKVEKARIEGILLEAYWYKGKGEKICRSILRDF
jgi:hypothetical protein